MPQFTLNTEDNNLLFKKICDNTAEIAQNITPISANFTRPADTTAYAVGDLVANSVTAGSVVAMVLIAGRVPKGKFTIKSARLQKSGVVVTNAQFRVHLYKVAPVTVTNGDNGAWNTSGVADYIGAIDITLDKVFTDGSSAMGIPVNSVPELRVNLSTGKAVYALLEARAAYTPVSAEVFTLVVDVAQR